MLGAGVWAPGGRSLTAVSSLISLLIEAVSSASSNSNCFVGLSTELGEFKLDLRLLLLCVRGVWPDCARLAVVVSSGGVVL